LSTCDTISESRALLGYDATSGCMPGLIFQSGTRRPRTRVGYRAFSFFRNHFNPAASAGHAE